MGCTLRAPRRSCSQSRYTVCSSGRVNEVGRKNHVSSRRPPREDAVLQYSIGNGARGQTYSDRQVGNHIGTTSTILRKLVSRGRVLVPCKIEPVAPTLSTLKDMVASG